MTSGGHARSGPAPSPGSARSDARDLSFTELPAEGYAGPIPTYPIPSPSKRDLEWWNWAWSTPQAILWATPRWAWIRPAVADWCRLKTQSESPDAPMSVWQAMARRESDILLNLDALTRAGYRIVVDELGARRTTAGKSQRARARDRLKVANAAQS